MKKGIKTVSAVLVLSLMTGTLSGCSKLFEGKKKESQEEYDLLYESGPEGLMTF